MTPAALRSARQPYPSGRTHDTTSIANADRTTDRMVPQLLGVAAGDGYGRPSPSWSPSQHPDRDQRLVGPNLASWAKSALSPARAS